MKKKIFISYAREDEKSASVLARHLKGLGYPVWWDRQVVIGGPYEAQIQLELDRADRVLLIWSAHAAKSAWVRNEAGDALAARKLIPIVIDATPLPLGLKHVQVLKTGRLEDDLDHVVAAIEAGRTCVRPESPPTKRPTLLLGIAASVVILAACAAAFSVVYPRPLSDCNLRGLDSQLDYRCYHSKKLRVKFVYPLSVLELDTTKHSDGILLLRNLSQSRRAEVVVTRTRSSGGDTQAARNDEERRLRKEGYVPNHLKPEEGERWENFYVITGWKPEGDIFYYKRWFIGPEIISIEFDYSAKDKRLYDAIIPDMVKDRFVLGE